MRRDGRVRAAGHPADHARLGVIERRLEEVTGEPGVVDRVAAQVVPAGKIKGTARRSLTIAVTPQASLLMPDADYCEVPAALFGALAMVPWRVPFTVSAATVFSAWREAAGAEPLEQLQDLVLAASAAGHQEHDYRAIEIGDLRLGAIDGTVTRMPDTAANRAVHGAATSGGTC